MNKKDTSPITTTQIARLAGVSIGSVDRALHNRPGINEKTKKKILEIARRCGYKPNTLGRILARRKPIALGAVFLPVKNPFQNFLMSAMKQAAEDYRDFGVSLELFALPRIDPAAAAKKIRDFLERGFDGLALEGFDDADLQLAVDQAAAAQIPVITFNSDMPKTKRMCFVGQDLYRSGQVAADLLCRFMAQKGKILVMHGSQKVDAHRRRFEGFADACKKDFPNIQIAGVQECLDKDELAYKITSAMIKKNPDAGGIYVIAGGTIGIAKAVSDMKMQGKISLVCNDLVPGVAEYIKSGLIDATILQDPKTQATLPVKLLYQKIAEGKEPQKECFYTKMEIITKYML